MKILCWTDNHFSEKSSIITKYGTNYTLRLENQIKSLNWLETLALQQDCDMVVCLGDFFDHAYLTDQELTALNEIQWANIPHFFIVGNHESEENALQYSSTMALQGPYRDIISQPTILKQQEVELAFLPYIVESNKKPISEYFSESPETLRILFSHNDVLGLQLGPVVCRTGFSTAELESVSHLCINGHLHNGQQISNGVVNLGNLTGKDFSEDASKYLHRALLINTDTMQVEFIENPHAFNFYKLDIDSEQDLDKLKNLKNNAVVSIKCKDFLIEKARAYIETLSNIVEFRLIITKSLTENAKDTLDIYSLCVDQCAKFADCCRAKLENSDILELELAEILK